jgi:hypothetical protein
LNVGKKINQQLVFIAFVLHVSFSHICPNLIVLFSKKRMMPRHIMFRQVVQNADKEKKMGQCYMNILGMHVMNL